MSYTIYQKCLTYGLSFNRWNHYMQENYKILVVDDDARLRALLERYLSEQGFQVRSVANRDRKSVV